MIGDVKRTTAYKNAIKKLDLKNKTVLDAGCGLGILGFFALKNGAGKVISVDNSSIIEKAKKISKINKFDSRISFIKGDLLKVRLSEKIDIIIHETIGNFLFNENTVAIISTLRERFLKKDGLIVPSKITWQFAPADFMRNKDTLSKSPHFWKSNPYNINFGILSSQEMFNPFHIALTDTSILMSKFASAYVLDYYTVKEVPKNFTAFFHITKNGLVNGLVSWFDIHLYQNVNLSTSPGKDLTHWKQMVFPLKDEIKVKKGDILIYSLKTNNSINPKKWKYGVAKVKS